MNILIVTPSWPQLENPNGIVTYYTNLIPALIALGHTVQIVTFDSTDESDNVHVINYQLSFIEKLWSKAKNFFEPGYDQYFLGSRLISDAISKVHIKTPVDIVQMEDSFGWHYYVQQQFSFPVVMRLHGPYFLNSFEAAVSVKTKNRLD
jgi:glycosyltransferase involved in cell wall biosynthesis